ncbi:response regulator [Cohnella sp. LGH]|uniref:response regulator transcription factor n=1 Tax=Cohnella sp. LGH TaxID=1619153 RepID=UPI001ADC03B9|nr:response regulator [Cohnella sp. LGH]QTH41341.1 response regulator [Cohnella sp. LGH]
MYTVLLVDDEPWAIEGLQMFVDWEGLGFRICGVCENGAEALAAARKLVPDVIVTDIRMPELDGLGLIGQLREESAAPAEFIVLSAYSEFAFAKRAMQLGVHHYLLKPIIEEEAAEVLTQIRMRLDVSKAYRHAANNGAEETSLPTLALQRMKDVLQAIEDADRGRAANVIYSLFQELGSRSAEWVELFAGSLTIRCSKLIRESGGDPGLLLSSRPDTELASVQTRILSYMEQVIGALQSLRERRPGNTMAEIDEYICEHYRDPLSIRDIAARFYLNPVYLGKAYQDKFGCGILERMHDLRIAEACEKLRGTSEPINAISEQVGYSHYHHFLQHFERRTDRKPAEYRAFIGDAWRSEPLLETDF